MPVGRKEIFTSDSTCFTCKCLLSEPYIRCAVCDYVMLCTQCFAKGEEKDCHENNHDYMVVKNDFPLIEGSGWTAKDVKSLVDLVQECGFGNWLDISRRLSGKSANECKRYYLQNFIDNQSLPGLPKINETTTSLFGPEPIPYNFKLENIEDPPRFAPGSSNYKLMAGYNAARSDFEMNFDNHAELLIANLNYKEFSPGEPYSKLGQELQVSLVSSYNTRLKERARRKKILRDHGLISSRKRLSSLQRYNTTVTRPLVERLRVFTQLVNGIEFDSILECLHRIGELKNHLGQLYHYRRNGLTDFHSIPMFKELSLFRHEFERDKRQYISNTEYNWRNIIPIRTSENSPTLSNMSQRRPAPPLNIHPGMIGYEKLLADERELCSIARVQPDVYLDLKTLLISENKKSGFVKLAQARQLLKIDVNKTKKIHEYLVKEGYININ